MNDTVITAPNPAAEIQAFLAENPEPASTPVVEEKPAPAPEAKKEATTPPPASPPAKPEPTLGSKAAKESKALRASKEKQATLEAKVAASAIAEQSATKLAKIEKLFKENPRAALIELGLEPTKTYMELTDRMLEQGVVKTDPVEEKLKAIDPYLETLKKKERELEEARLQLDVKAMIQRDVFPVIAKTDDYECLYDFFSTDTSGKPLTSDQVKNLVAKSVFDNANDYFNNQLKGSNELLIKEHGTIEVFFTKIAAHLEKQLEDGLDQSIKKVARLNKFKNRLPTKTEQSSKETVSDQITLDDVMNVSKETPAVAPKRQSDIRYAAREQEIAEFLKEQGLI